MTARAARLVATALAALFVGLGVLVTGVTGEWIGAFTGIGLAVLPWEVARRVIRADSQAAAQR